MLIDDLAKELTKGKQACLSKTFGKVNHLTPMKAHSVWNQRKCTCLDSCLPGKSVTSTVFVRVSSWRGIDVSSDIF